MAFGLIVAGMVLAGVRLVSSRGADLVAWAVVLIGLALTYRF